MTSKIANLSPDTLENLAQLYTIENPGEVETYLENQPHLVGFLQEMHANVRKFFPTEELRLAYKATKYNDAGWWLVITIQAGGKVGEVLMAFEELKETKWFEAQELILGDEATIYVQHRDLPPDDPWDDMERLIGSVDAPLDWYNHHQHEEPKLGNGAVL